MNAEHDDGDEGQTDEPTGEIAEDSAESERVYSGADVKALLASAAEEAKDRQLRLAAEYDNFRRRVQREKEQWTVESLERLVRDLLPIMDNLDSAISTSADTPGPLRDGVMLTSRRFATVLDAHGIAEINPLFEVFDPKLHEAVQREPVPGKSPPGTVTMVFEKGYTMKGRLLRPARVQVAGDV